MPSTVVPTARLQPYGPVAPNTLVQVQAGIAARLGVQPGDVTVEVINGGQHVRVHVVGMNGDAIKAGI